MMIYFKLKYYLEKRILYSYQYRIKKGGNPFKEKLISENKNRWLDLGSYDRYSDGFYFADIIDPNTMSDEMQSRYFQWDATKDFSLSDKQKMGTFDFIRMQHVFEHFTLEDGKKVLKNAFELLNQGGYLLITVPDLKKFVERYNYKMLDKGWTFAEFAEGRIGKNAPQSFYFSVFTHHSTYQPHLWCYDQEGLLFQIQKSVSASKIEFMSPYHKWASIPFTHNRPLEDLCVLIQK